MNYIRLSINVKCLYVRHTGLLVVIDWSLTNEEYHVYLYVVAERIQRSVTTN